MTESKVSIRVTFISDTHGNHDQLRLAPGDLLVHCGDFMSSGRNVEEILSFVNWLDDQPFRERVIIAGNHDLMLEQLPVMEKLFGDIHYLHDSSCDVMGLKIWGSPVTPRFLDWAFMRERGEDIARTWQGIPTGLDILITHGPPHGVLDQLSTSPEHLGCEELRTAVLRTQPRVHAFGHIHGGYGTTRYAETTYVNAATLNERYEVANAPITIELDVS